MKPFKAIYLFFSALLILCLTPDPSRAISIVDEKKMADQFMKMIERQKGILEDPIVTHMVQQVGRHLISFIGEQPFDYTFYVVDEDVFNAFAAPGAHIFFYRGLITSLDSIDEFAGIVGHEIAHAASRHVAESIDRSKYISIGSLAGMLAGAIIGGTSDSDAGAAIAKGTIALSQTAMLSFTRENETEADEKGLMFLKSSCFDPQGLVSGLLKIRDADFRGIEQVPEYVKTHPGTGNRIAHTETILSGYVPPKDKAACPEDFRFDMVKYRLWGLYADLDKAFAKLTAMEKKDPSNAAVMYGLGFAYERKFMMDKAMAYFKKALAINIFDPLILLEMGRLYSLDNQYEKALKVLSGLESDPVISVMARFHQADARFEMGELKKAKIGFNGVVNKAASIYPKAYLKLANIYSLEKNQGLSSYNLGLYYAQIKREKTAVLHLKKALDTLEDGPEKKRAEKLLKQLKKQASKKRSVR